MFVLVILVAVCLVDCTVTAVDLLEKPFYDLEDAESLFEDFLKEHEKSYNPREYKQRLEIFIRTLDEINDRNAKHPQTVFAVNHFADLTLEEREQYFGFKPSNSNATDEFVDLPNGPLAESLDWREKGLVSSVKNQGKCGSCYIFSAIGNIEGQYAIKHHQCPDLSEGQALDCLSQGCEGGEMYKVMQDFVQRAGVNRLQDYPYVPHKGSCHEDTSKVLAHVTGAINLQIADENALMQAVTQYGPLAVALAAQDMPVYAGGILHPQQCVGNDINHAVLLVGYGEENGTKFWIIKNSWGVRWGEQGYLRLVRGVNACQMGTNKYTATATVA